MNTMPCGNTAAEINRDIDFTIEQLEEYQLATNALRKEMHQFISSLSVNGYASKDKNAYDLNDVLADISSDHAVWNYVIGEDNETVCDSFESCDGKWQELFLNSMLGEFQSLIASEIKRFARIVFKELDDE